MKRYELVFISSKRYNYKEECYGYAYEIRDMLTGYNFETQFIKFNNKRTLIKFLRKSGVVCPHRVYRAVG